MVFSDGSGAVRLCCSMKMTVKITIFCTKQSGSTVLRAGMCCAKIQNVAILNAISGWQIANMYAPNADVEFIAADAAKKLIGIEANIGSNANRRATLSLKTAFQCEKLY